MKKFHKWWQLILLLFIPLTMMVSLVAELNPSISQEKADKVGISLIFLMIILSELTKPERSWNSGKLALFRINLDFARLKYILNKK